MDTFYVFYVNKSHLLAIDLQSSATTIKQVQQNVRQKTGVRSDDQVLLIASGETVDPLKRTTDYPGYGTCNRPLFLFQRSSRLDKDEMTCSQEIKELFHAIDDSIDQAQRIESNDLKVVYLSMPERARQCKTAAVAAVHMCARLVHEHQLLQQGWLALVSNMDESIQKLQRRAAKHQQSVDNVNEQRGKADAILENFDVVLEQLKMIKLPTVLAPAKDGENISLFDWISAADNSHSLKELVEQVTEQFKKFSEAETRATAHTIDLVVEQSKNIEYREIKGINKRLTQLDQNLITVEEREKKIAQLVAKVTQTPPRIDNQQMQDLIAEYRGLMENIFDQLKELRQMCSLFHKSKTEVLNNMRTRLNGWIVQAYERLHTSHTDMMLFEEKFNGLRQRLDLVRQIKEAPIMYATAVVEVIRRSAFRKEFFLWHKNHAGKCSTLSQEESTNRGDFSQKLKKHFLRVLFPGMFDELPEFFIKEIPSFDDKMAPINTDYLRELRENASELEKYLRVTSPQVLTRLGFRDGGIGSTSSGGQLKREDSFFTHEATDNIAAMGHVFPSTTWLCGEDMMGSPGGTPTLRMCDSPMSRQGSSIPIAPSLHYINEFEVGNSMQSVIGTSVATSAPINIPQGREVSLPVKSHHMSTSDENVEPADAENCSGQGSGSVSQFPLDDLTTKSQSLEYLKPIMYELATLSKNVRDIRAEYVNNVDKFVEDFATISKYSSDIVVAKNSEILNKFEAEIQQHNANTEKLTLELQEANKKIEFLELDVKNKSKDIEDKDLNMEKLISEAVILTEKAQTIERDMFRKMTIEYELIADRQRVTHEEILEERDREIRQLKKELERKDEQLELLKSEPGSEEFRNLALSEIRADVEKEFKGKIDLITMGLTQQKDDVIARFKKETEIEMRDKEHKMNLGMKWLTIERDELRSVLVNSNMADVVTDIDNKLQEKVQNDTEKNAPFFTTTSSTQTDGEVDVMMESVQVSTDKRAHAASMGSSQFVIMAGSILGLESRKEQALESQEQNGSQLTQTKLSMKSLETMVSVQEISEGSNVLVIWDDRHNAYILFSACPYMHFVKESSIRRLGIGTPAVGTPRRNWILAKVTHMDLCLIRKADNRYHLPVDTRVYRVDVDPVALDVKVPKHMES